LLDVSGKRIHHSAFIITLVCPEEAADECVYLTAMKFDRKTAIAGPMSCPASPHSLC
jgi:hypothetical protein